MKDRLQSLRIGAALLLLAVCGNSAWAANGPGADGDPRRFLVGATGLLIFLLVVLIFKAAIVTYTLGATELMPSLFRRSRRILVASPVKSFLVGLVNTILALFIGTVLLQHPATLIFGSLLLIALLLALFASRALLYPLLGARLIGEVRDPEVSPSPRAHCWGGAVLELGFLVPFVGWLTDLIVTLTTTGALVLGTMSRERVAARSGDQATG